MSHPPPLVPTFRSSCYIGTHSHELRKVVGTSKHMDSSAAFLFEVPGSNSPLVVQELQIGGTKPANDRVRDRTSTRRPATRGDPAPRTPRRPAHRRANRRRRPKAHPGGSVHKSFRSRR